MKKQTCKTKDCTNTIVRTDDCPIKTCPECLSEVKAIKLGIPFAVIYLVVIVISLFLIWG